MDIREDISKPLSELAPGSIVVYKGLVCDLTPRKIGRLCVLYSRACGRYEVDRAKIVKVLLEAKPEAKRENPL